jgi:hypothetical protein
LAAQIPEKGGNAQYTVIVENPACELCERCCEGRNDGLLKPDSPNGRWQRESRDQMRKVIACGLLRDRTR